jgi:drug/metabolite transporter (DMT)-like permease
VAVADHDDRGRSALTLGLLAVTAAVVMFAFSLSVIKWPGIAGSSIAWWRLVGSTILWWGFLVIRRRRTGRPLPGRAGWLHTAPAALAFGVNISVIFLAVTRTSVAHADFISSMAPIVLIPAGVVFFRERPRWRALGWGLLSIAGLLIILTNGPANGVATLRGDILVGFGVLSFAVYQLLAKRARALGVEPFEFMAILMPIALVTATPIALVSAGDDLWPLSTTAWASVAILSVMTGMVAHGLLYYAQRSVPIATISMIQTSQPSMSTFWAWLLLGEAVSTTQVPGMLLATLGVALVVSFSRRTTG